MSGTIESVLSIEEVRVKANHGWYESERKIGGMYLITVRAYLQLNMNETLTDLSHTINYEKVHQIIIDTMSEEHHLIESACKTIFDKLKSDYQNEIWEVFIRKEDVPLKYVGSTSYSIKG